VSQKLKDRCDKISIVVTEATPAQPVPSGFGKLHPEQNRVSELRIVAEGNR